EGLAPNGTPERLDAATISVTAGTDQLDAQLLKPITNLQRIDSGAATAKVTGDLARWRERMARFVPIPAEWKLGGNGTISGNLSMDAERYRLTEAAGDLFNVQFAGAGLLIQEPQVKLLPTNATWERASKVLNVGELQFASRTVGLVTKQLRIQPSATGVQIESVLLANVDLARLQQVIQPGVNPNSGDAIGGLIQSGTVTLRTEGSQYRFKTTLPVDGLRYGSVQQPTWLEPKLTVTSDGLFDTATDTLTLDVAKVARPQGLAADAKGSIQQVSTRPTLNINGQLDYDLTQLEPQLRQILGTNLKVRGAGKKDFFLQGPLQDNAGHLLAALRGQAILGWQSVQAYGFDVGPADLTAKLDNGTLQFDTVEAKFGTIGKVRATPQIRFQPQGTFLNFEKGRIVDHAMLTPAVCADTLGYALPLLAKATETEGSISLDLTENSIPLADPEAATLRGALQLHQVKTGPGPLMTQL
ncbi:MAG: hypothetical protein ACRCZF_11405, partial [Gemmataceae bacterium]